MISFRGQFINPIQIQQNQPDGITKISNGSFVKLNPEDLKDVSALAKAVSSWQGSKSIATYIVQNIYAQNFFSHELDIEPTGDYFIATTQTKNFDTLDATKILGVIQTDNLKNNLTKIEYLEVNPEFAYENKNRQLRNIGHMIIQSIKDFFPENDLTVNPKISATKFYAKEGFKQKTPHRKIMIYER